MPLFDFKCKKCGHEFEDQVRMDVTEMKCPRCGKKAEKQFTPCMNLHVAFRNDTQSLNRKLYQMNKELERRQDSQGYGPYVDRKRAETKIRRPRAKKQEADSSTMTPKQLAGEYKKVRQRKKLY